MLPRVIANPSDDCKNSPPLAAILREEVARTGPLTCARFMAAALYHPELGYYERTAEVVGQRGDFYTSVTVGELFGELLAYQFAAWLAPRVTSASGPVACQLLEAGAHDGQLAEDILTWLQAHRPELLRACEYWILDPSPRRQAWQRRRLSRFAPRVRWFANWDEIHAAGGVHGVIFANELLDAFPIHRLTWSAAEQRWHECGVQPHGDGFAWTRLATLSPAVADLAHPAAALGPPDDPQVATAWATLAALLPDGFVLERAPAAEQWWHLAAQHLRHGQLLTLDYGHDSPLHPAKPAGTLRAYRRHQLSPDPLAHPGEQDLTAHVNFAALTRAGESAGLTTVERTGQSRFLTRIAQQTMRVPEQFGPWTPSRTRQLQTLVHPEHLGTAFTALVQARPAP